QPHCKTCVRPAPRLAHGPRRFPRYPPGRHRQSRRPGPRRSARRQPAHGRRPNPRRRRPHLIAPDGLLWYAAPTVDAVDEVTQFLATVPTPEQILAFRASPAVEQRISTLLEKNRTTGLSEEEEREWQTYEYAGHLTRMAKAHAALLAWSS